MEDRETARMRKYGKSETTRIMMATVPHVTSGLGLRKFQTDGFLLTRVYMACLVLHFEAFAAVTKNLAGLYFPLMGSYPYTGCFTTSGHNCWR